MSLSDKKKLQQLTQKWYKKIAKAGFEDAEMPNGMLKKLSSYRLRSKEWDTSDVALRTRQRYYELARQFYHDHVFETSLEKEIWRLHSEGVTIREILKQVKRMSWSGIQRVTQRLANEMLSQRVGLRND